MENREIGLQVIYNRIKDNRTSLGVATFRRTPTRPVEESDLLCIFMSEGVDRIIKPSSRNWLGYPARRDVEIVIEMINTDDFDIRTFFVQLRSVVLSGARLTDDCIVRETRAVGPTNYRAPNIIGMHLVLGMMYTDNG